MALRKRILIVDDDRSFLDTLHLILFRDKHHVITAASGREAISLYPQIKPDLVFMDIRMPDIDGYKAFIQIRKRDRDLRVVFTSSYDMDDTLYEEIRSRHKVVRIKKPTEPAVIRRMIREYAK
jgi:two-component system chemotaxis response regulator CheY